MHMLLLIMLLYSSNSYCMCPRTRGQKVIQDCMYIGDSNLQSPTSHPQSLRIVNVLRDGMLRGHWPEICQ